MGIGIITLWAALSAAPAAAGTPSLGVWAVPVGRVPPAIMRRAQDTVVKGSAELHTRGPTAKEQKKLTPLSKRCKPTGSPTCAKSAAEIFGAKEVLTVRVSKVQKKYLVILELVDANGLVGTIQTTVRPVRMAQDLTPILATFVGQVKQLRTPPAVAAAPDALPPLPPELPAEPIAAAAPAPAPVPAEPMPATPVAIPTVPAARDDGDWLLESPDPQVVLAVAELAEIDGKLEDARSLLGQAEELAANDARISFARAKFALAHPAQSFDTEVAGFLAHEWPSAEAQLLRAYVLLHQGKQDLAKAGVDRALALEADHSEALRLHTLIVPPTPPPLPTEPLVSARLSVGAQGDSNIAVLPDDVLATKASDGIQADGVRALLDGLVTLTPLSAPRHLDFAGRVNLSRLVTPVSEDDPIFPYVDVLTTGLLAKTERKLGGLTTSAELSAALTLVDAYKSTFTREVGARLGATISQGRLIIAPYVNVAARDFVFDNSEGDAADRDGIRTEAGGEFFWRQKRTSLRARLAGLLEVAEGDAQKVGGGIASVGGAIKLAPLVASADVTYELRSYIKREDAGLPARQDQRITPVGRLAFDIADGYQAYAAYMFVKNISLAELSYTRHVATVGVQAQW